MNLQPRKESIIVQNEILLNTQGQIFKVGGITLDASAFPERIVKAGTAVMKDVNTGLFVPYADSADDAGGATFPAGAEVYITAQDSVVGTQEGERANTLVGAYIEAYLNTSRLTGVTEAFKAQMASRYIFG